MIKLYGVALSPFARKALLALEYKGLEFENVQTFPGDESAEFRAISPLGKIPVLEHDGFTIPDTSVICRYLDRVAPERPLFPADAKLEAQAGWIEEFADSRLVEACAGLFRERVIKPRMLNEPTDEAHVASLLDEELPNRVSYLESITPPAGPLVGDALTIADIAVVTCFIQSGYVGYQVDAQTAPNLSGYLDRMLSEPLFVSRLEREREVMPPGLLD